MSRELQDALGKRLYDLARFANHPMVEKPLAPDWEFAGSISREWWRHMARECIRQMEWARGQVHQDWTGACEADVEECCWKPCDLTLAPDDWKPTE